MKRAIRVSCWAVLLLLTAGVALAQPPAPTLKLPADAATGVSTTPTLSWGQSAGALTYEVEVHADAGFSSLVESSGDQADSSYTVTGPLSAGTTYYWRVKATNLDGDSGFSSRSFTTAFAVNGAPALVAPADAATDVSRQPFLDWSAASGTVSSYRIDVSSDGFSTFAVSDSSIGSGTTDFTPSSNLAAATTFSWRVRAKNPDGVPGPWSAVRTFTTVPAPPAAPTLTSPADAATGVSESPTLMWNAVSGATSYTVDVDDNDDFSSIEQTQTGASTSFSTSSLAKGTTHYWRVKATNSGGDSGFSMRSFTTLFDPVGAPSLDAPADAATNVALQPLFDWDAASGPVDSYRIDVSDDGFSTFAVSDSSIGSGTTNFTPSSNLANATTYSWRVRAKNPDGVPGPWSSTRTFTTIPAAPPAPTLTSPADAATGVSVTPTLMWNASAGATSYTAEVDDNSDFSSIEHSQTGGSTSFATPTLAKGTIYYWRVKATNGGGDSPFSMRSFTTVFDPPGAPTLTSPANGAINVSRTPTLMWNAGSGTSTSYRVDVSTESDFTPIVISDSSSTTTSFAIASTLDPEQEYFWRVRGKNSGGPGPFSSTRSFTTVPAPPPVVTLLSPADDAVEVPLTPTFEWESLSEADTYRILVSEFSDFSSILIQQDGLVTNSFTPGAPLSVGTEYFWRVRGQNAGGPGPFASIWSFTTEESKQVILLSPSNGGTGIALSPTLSWNAVNGATSYRVQVSKSANMSSPVIDQSGVAATSLAIGPLDQSTIYHWRVRANNADSDLWSTVWSFVTGTGAPGPIELESPADNATAVALLPTFKWKTEATATSYRFDLSTSAGFGTFVVSQSGLTDTTFIPASDLDPEQEYFWRVRGTNGQGNGQFSAVFSFTTSVAAPGAPTLTAPEDGALAVSTTPTFIWGAVTQGLPVSSKGSTAADSYDLVVATDGNFNSLVVEQTGITATNYNGATLSHGVEYFWRVRGRNDAGPGPFSTTFSFITIAGGPQQVALLSPEDEETEVDLSPVLMWNSVSGAATYQVQVSEQANFLTVVFNRASVAGTQTQVTDLDGLTEYFWRVRATNSGSENWSETWSFVTASGTPDAVTLISPIDGATNLPVEVMLSWNQAQKADEYEVQVHTSNSFTDPDIVLSGIAGTSTLLTSLVNGQVYYWRVRGVNAVTEGEWSPSRGFITIRGGDTQVQIISPPGGTTGVPLETELVWHEVEGAATYHVQVGTSFSFNLNSIVFEDSQFADTVFQLFDLAPDTTYAWRVKASNAGVNNWSITASFVTGKGVPSQVILESPLDDAVDVDLEPQLIWTVPPRATAFDLEIGLDENFSTVLLSESDLTEVMFDVPTLDPVTDYYWRVRGVNQDGEGPWSETRKFTTIGVEPPAPATLVSPLNGATEVSFKPLFSWNASAGASSYKLEVATNASFTTVTIAVVVAQPFFQSAGLALGEGYFWRVEARNAGGSALSEVWSFTTVLDTDTEDEEIPEDFSLSQNYPNPFNPSTAIEFAMPRAGEATLIVYNVRGEEIARLVDGFTGAGRHTVRWDAGSLPSGVYLYRLVAEGFTEVRKLTLAK